MATDPNHDDVVDESRETEAVDPNPVIESEAALRAESAARAEEFAASAEAAAGDATTVDDMNHQHAGYSGVTSPEEDDEKTQPGLVTAGYADIDYARAERAPLELLLGKPWAISKSGMVEVATRLALQTQGQMRGDEQLLRLQAAARQPLPRPTAADGSKIAIIPLRGTITPRGSLFSLVFGGGGGLQLFREQFRQAMADNSVSAIVFDIDSPGGIIDLVPETTAEILNARGTKPITAVANTTMASAAYWIASAADSIVATPSAQVGSIGVFTVHEDISRAEAAMGITTTIISAGQFKTEGNPYEPLSKAAKNALQGEIDELYGMFTGQVAAGRGTNAKAVQAGYGQGRCLLADQAKLVGMVDRVETLEQTIGRLGGTLTAQVDPAALPGDLEDCDDDSPNANADAEKPAAPKTSPQMGDQQQDVSAPPADYLSTRPKRWL